MKKILIIPPMPWYMMAHAEYLVRQLSDEFLIEVAEVPYPPYNNFLDRFPETQPSMRNPDDYDLLWPLLPTHWGVTERDKYAHKVASVFYQPSEGRQDIKVLACSTPIACKAFGSTFHHHLRFGIDIDLFKPLGFARESKKLVVGMVGTIVNPRRMVKEVIMPLYQLDDIEVVLFSNSPLDEHSVDDTLGGRENLKHIRSCGVTWPALPNIYNRLDVLIRCDSDPGYGFPAMEAAACGVPIIATNQGIEHHITEAGGGILIDADVKDEAGSGRAWYLDNPNEVAKRVKDAVIYLRDHPRERFRMGIKAREEIEANWTWDKFIHDWARFFRQGTS